MGVLVLFLYFIIKFVWVARNVWAGELGQGTVLPRGRQQLRGSLPAGDGHLSANDSQWVSGRL